MIYFDPDRPEKTGDGSAFRNDEDDRTGAPLPTSAQRTLSDLSDALGVTASLLRRADDHTGASAGTSGLMEASALLQAFFQIEDPLVRQRCLTYVQNAAAAESE